MAPLQTFAWYKNKAAATVQQSCMLGCQLSCESPINKLLYSTSSRCKQCSILHIIYKRNPHISLLRTSRKFILFIPTFKTKGQLHICAFQNYLLATFLFCTHNVTSFSLMVHRPNLFFLSPLSLSCSVFPPSFCLSVSPPAQLCIASFHLPVEGRVYLCVSFPLTDIGISGLRATRPMIGPEMEDPDCTFRPLIFTS